MGHQRGRGIRGAVFGALFGGVLGVIAGLLVSLPGAPKRVEVHQEGLVELAEEATAPLEAVIGLIRAAIAAGVVGLIGAVGGAALGTSVALRGPKQSAGQPPPVGFEAEPGTKSAESTGGESGL